jgi:hypothetical protein
MSADKAMTLRLSSWHHIALKCMAAAGERTVSDEIRLAIEDHIEARKLDPAFQRRVRAQIEANQEILDRFAATHPHGEEGSDDE